MRSSRPARAAWLLLLLIACACAPPTPRVPGTTTALSTEARPPSATGTAAPPVSSLQVDPEALRGARVEVWHPWFGAEASLFEAQVAQFNTVNEWGIIVDATGQGNYSELFLQMESVLRDGAAPEIAIALPEHALAWDEHVVDLTPYVNDPLYGLSPSELSDFPGVVWQQDEVDDKRYGLPAQRTARFLLYNRSWGRELGFDSPPSTAAEFERQACAAHRALGTDADPGNDPLGGWLIDTHAITPLSWMRAFGGGVQEEDGYRFLQPGNIAALRFLKDLQQDGCAWVSSPDLAVADRFAARQALFITASLEDLPAQVRAFSAVDNADEWTVLSFPGEEREALVVYGSSFIVLESDDVTRLASWLFLRWVLSAENQARWVQSTGLFPLRRSAIQALGDYPSSHPQWAEAVSLLPEGETTPQLASWRVVRVMLEDGFRDMFDTIRHPDLSAGQVPLILKQMDDTAADLNR